MVQYRQIMAIFPNLPLQSSKIFHRSLSIRKLKNWYANLKSPSPNFPPYSHVIQIGDPLLRTKSDLVPNNLLKSDELKFLITRLKTILHQYKCVGLAAPQIGIPLRVFVIEFSGKQQNEFSKDVINNRKMRIVPFTAFVNPELRIVDYTKITYPEACESVKGFSADVTRYAGVEVNAFDENGDEIKVEADGWTARIIQHEMDHLEGKIYTDVMDRKTLSCTCWQAVNERSGKIELPYFPV